MMDRIERRTFAFVQTPASTALASLVFVEVKIAADAQPRGAGNPAGDPARHLQPAGLSRGASARGVAQGDADGQPPGAGQGSPGPASRRSSCTRWPSSRRPECHRPGLPRRPRAFHAGPARSRAAALTCRVRRATIAILVNPTMVLSAQSASVAPTEIQERVAAPVRAPASPIPETALRALGACRHRARGGTRRGRLCRRS